MHELLQDPWSDTNNRIVHEWISDALRDGVIETDDPLDANRIVDVVEHIPKLGKTHGLSQLEAGVLMALWAGRACEAMKMGKEVLQGRAEEGE
jgi:hypothetical protein